VQARQLLWLSKGAHTHRTRYVFMKIIQQGLYIHDEGRKATMEIEGLNSKLQLLRARWSFVLSLGFYVINPNNVNQSQSVSWHVLTLISGFLKLLQKKKWISGNCGHSAQESIICGFLVVYEFLMSPWISNANVVSKKFTEAWETYSGYRTQTAGWGGKQIQKIRDSLCYFPFGLLLEHLARFPHSPILHYAYSSLFKENNSAYF